MEAGSATCFVALERIMGSFTCAVSFLRGCQRRTTNYYPLGTRDSGPKKGNHSELSTHTDGSKWCSSYFFARSSLCLEPGSPALPPCRNPTPAPVLSHIPGGWLTVNCLVEARLQALPLLEPIEPLLLLAPVSGSCSLRISSEAISNGVYVIICMAARDSHP